MAAADIVISPSIMARQGASNSLIQLATLLSKSLLLFILARYLSVAEVGLFGLVVVTLGLGIHLLGLDFYAFTTRELIGAERAQLPVMLRDQAVFHLLTYPPGLLLAVLPFIAGTLPWSLLGPFLALLLVEHLGQEVQRVLVTLGRPVQGAFVLFVRGGVWVWVAALVLLSSGDGRDLATVLRIWLGGSLAALTLGLALLRDLPWGQLRQERIDWRWIRRGLGIASPFLLASLSYRGLLAIDRYTLAHFAGVEAVGVYSFYANVRSAILSFTEMGILFVYRPRVVAAFQTNDLERYRSLLREMGRLLIASSAILALLAAAAVFPLLDFVGKAEYREHLPILWPILLSALLASAAELPHTVLYAERRDRALIMTTVLVLMAAVPVHILLVGAWGIFGAATASAASFALLGSVKYAAARP
jgi:O-antigen/teichoic acid export membrane protein